MNTRTIVTVMTVALLSASFVSVSSAQDNHTAMPDGIEVITIVAKRPAQTVASACVSAVRAGTNAIERTDGEGSVGGEVLGSNGSGTGSMRESIRRCIEQAATSRDAQI